MTRTDRARQRYETAKGACRWRAAARWATWLWVQAVCDPGTAVESLHLWWERANEALELSGVWTQYREIKR